MQMQRYGELGVSRQQWGLRSVGTDNKIMYLIIFIFSIILACMEGVLSSDERKLFLFCFFICAASLVIVCWVGFVFFLLNGWTMTFLPSQSDQKTEHVNHSGRS